MHHARESEDMENPPGERSLMGGSNGSNDNRNVSPEVAYANRVTRFMKFFEMGSSLLMFSLILLIIIIGLSFLITDWEDATCNGSILTWIILDLGASISSGILCIFRIVKIVRRENEQSRRAITGFQNVVNL